MYFNSLLRLEASINQRQFKSGFKKKSQYETLFAKHD